MDGRRRHRFEFHDQPARRPRSYPRKPPLATWQPTVPMWEKQFCFSVGSVPWQKLLDAKRFMYLFEDVVNWDDCAVEEAFHNAKKRYWAEFHGLPCDIPLPDPDIYIDQIDWNSKIDPELILDLEQGPEPPEKGGEDEKGAILNSSLLLNHQSFLCAGWGNEEDFPKEPTLGFAPVYGRDCILNADNDKNSWEQDCAPCNEAGKNDGWGSYFNDSWGCIETRKDDGGGSMFNDSAKCNQLGSNYDRWEASFKEVSNGDDRRGGRDWRTWNWDNTQKREGTGQYMSRYKTSRLSSNEYQMDQGWKNRKGWKRSNIACR